MKYKNIIFSLLLIPAILLCFYVTYNYSQQMFKSNEFIQSEISPDRLQFMPVTEDFRNYFVLQCIENTVSVLIGDFTGIEKVISIAKDKNGDGKPEEVYEYFPEVKKLTTPLKPTTSFYKGIDDLKKEIIMGDIFTINYSYKMNSLPLLKAKLKSGRDVYKFKHGYSVKMYDPDAPTTITGEYFFGKKEGKYDLIFTTYYYKLYRTKISPPLIYSVYCKDTNDKYIADIVEELLKMVE
ncbi:MAG: hypothetical protein N3F66_11805 [Spirochaetes bacterium]|nr:hypothetical protein [Spirochaetota bacterium]